MDATALLERALGDDRRALARAITWIELRRGGIGGGLAARSVRRRTGPGAPAVIGVTGPPGAGKSTLVDALISRARGRGERVAVVAVDPSSPFSGGAILGDRIRMEGHTGDDGVFVRSLSSRGHLGGLSAATAEVVDLFDAAGFDLVLVETVGVGQSELGVMEVADTVVVVLTPESGDAVQAMKAGLLEVADVFVVNKADRPGADALARELERSVALAEAPWTPPVLTAVAAEGAGIEPLGAAIDRHLAWSAGEGRAVWDARRGQARVRLALDLVAEAAQRTAVTRFGDVLEKVRSGELPPNALIEHMGGT
jgi:LAO/AO transport system kinase